MYTGELLGFCKDVVLTPEGVWLITCRYRSRWVEMVVASNRAIRIVVCIPYANYSYGCWVSCDHMLGLGFQDSSYHPL